MTTFASDGLAPISKQIWDMKYRFKEADGTPVDLTIDQTWKRIANALAQAEAADKRDHYSELFYSALEGFSYLPAGRIQAGAGTGRTVTLFNCFVMGTIPDDMAGIFESLKEAALTMQQGGGIGYDFSTIRPKGALVKGVGADASGPVTFMDVWDSMCRTIMSAGSRRGAMMGTMRCDHPDIEKFIEAKRDSNRLRMFNLSVLVTDPFIEAVKEDKDWNLTFEDEVYETLRARDLWDKIMQATYDYAEPGVIFIDRINDRNNLHYCETISATNPCGEQPLPPYGACLLGSVNLATMVVNPFEETAHLDLEKLNKTVRIAVRMMDNVVDVSRFPLDEQTQEARAKRRIGLGVTGLADALIMCKSRYGSAHSVELTEQWMKAVRDSAYHASVDLAEEKGPFPLFEAKSYLSGSTIQELPEDLRKRIDKHGIRNALVTSIAPTGTISLFADNVSSGLEPVFSYEYSRKVLQPDGTRTEETVSDFAYRLFREKFGKTADLPDYFVSAQTLSPSDHVRIQAAAQKFVDSSISKTINCPEDISFEAFKSVYMDAYDSGCKGCTTYRPNEITGSILSVETKDAKAKEKSNVTAHPAMTGDVASSIVHLTKPLERPETLPGNTFKIKWPDSEHAIYITLNDIIEGERRRPFEIFINSKNMDHFAWTVALTRMISAVFRRGGDVTFVVEELKAVFDPRGGQWMKGRYVPSILAAIGDVIETHMKDIGFIADENSEPNLFNQNQQIVNAPDIEPENIGGAKICTKCLQPTLIRQEGCETCLSCGFSKCG